MNNKNSNPKVTLSGTPLLSRIINLENSVKKLDQQLTKQFQILEKSLGRVLLNVNSMQTGDNSVTAEQIAVSVVDATQNAKNIDSNQLLGGGQGGYVAPSQQGRAAGLQLSRGQLIAEAAAAIARAMHRNL